MKPGNILLWVIGALVCLKLILLLNPAAVWWDSGIYIGMGKALFSGGISGYWEDLRPPLMGIMLGLPWRLGLDPLAFAAVFYTGLFALNLWLAYKCGSRIFDERIGLLAAVLLAATPLFFDYSAVPLSESPSITFALIAILLYLGKSTLFPAGIFAGLAFLTRFPQGMIIAAMSLSLFFRPSKNILKEEALLLAGFLLVVGPYLGFNYFHYGNPVQPLILAGEVIKEYSWLYDLGPAYYLHSIAKESALFIFSILGIYLFLSRQKNHRGFAALVAMVLIFIYFTLLQHKEARFMLILLPYLCIFASAGIVMAVSRLKPAQLKTIFAIIVSVVIAAMLIRGIFGNFGGDKNPTAEEFYNYPRQNNLTGIILGTNPAIMAYADNKFEKLGDWYRAPKVLAAFRSQEPILAIESCQYPAQPEDAAFLAARDSFLSDVSRQGRLLYNITVNGCFYSIYKFTSLS